MKTITIIVTIIAIYFIWQIVRESLGCAIVCACGAIFVLLWLNDLPAKRKKYTGMHTASRQQNELINK